MRWDEVMEAVEAYLNADALLVGEMGGSLKIWPAETSRTVQYPSIEWTVTTDIETEVFNPVLVQFDIYAPANYTTGKTPQQVCAAIERRLRRLLGERRGMRDIGGVQMLMSFSDARTFPVPEPDVFARQVDFLFEPIRERYAAATLA